MADTANTYEPHWRRCDDCDVTFFIGATLNPRNHKWRPIPLSAFEDQEGNFDVDWNQSQVEVFDADNNSLGVHPVVVYGTGVYRPHNPSHFLDHSHGEDQPRQRLHNFRLLMDDPEEDDE
jgi:hypothetical protein